MKDEETRKGPAQWLLIVLLASAVLLSSLSTVDRYAEQEYENLFQRALITFALPLAMIAIEAVGSR